ncbi:allophanate hydrolase-related protein [Falsiroseomonas tokyonensis]|uniref:Gamma-glutamylcyclotransferase n=1 Tax=Falsiroseomonas tokyonensis TaxID=430521 RepID=A0ABV7BZ97_9PROT|nr:gamma-glutamylcyclotransferase [Falsiroseomonas tokyonensis]MBU8540968.1 amidase [Falsiroseomonas tokyonensis]
MTAEALLLAVGNHLQGLPRHHELAGRGARLLGAVRTAPSYRLLARGAAPPFNPGLVEAGAGAGASIGGELYALPEEAIAELAALVRAPIRLGQVALQDGRMVHGYLCDPAAAAAAQDISDLGDWRAFLAMAGA